MGCEAEQLPLSNIAAGNTWSYNVTPAYVLIQQIYICQINNIFSKKVKFVSFVDTASCFKFRKAYFQ